MRRVCLTRWNRCVGIGGEEGRSGLIAQRDADCGGVTTKSIHADNVTTRNFAYTERKIDKRKTKKKMKGERLY